MTSNFFCFIAIHMNINKITTHIYTSPVGDLILGSIDGDLCICDWIGSPHKLKIDRRLMRSFDAAMEPGNSDTIRCAVSMLDSYFSDKEVSMNIPLRLAGTPFQRAVWREISHIPYGETITYRDLAIRVCGRPESARAVAQATGANPLSLFIPCHRVIAAASSGGYAGGSVAKTYLLNHEKNVTLHCDELYPA